MKSDNKNPGEIRNTYWVHAFRKKGEYPDHTENGGKWLIFVDKNKIDKVWNKIKTATENGLLGGESKAATAKDNPNAVDSGKKVICVYTYDFNDKEDVMRIREELRKLGIINKIPYKTDIATMENQYQIKGHKRISIYYE